MSFGDIAPDVKCVSEFYNISGPELSGGVKNSYSYRLMLLREGECRIDIGGKSYRLSTGDLIYFPPGEDYRTDFRDDESSVINVFFDWRHIRPDDPMLTNVAYAERYDTAFAGEIVRFADAPRLNFVQKISGFSDGAVILGDMLREYNAKRRFSALRLSALLTELFVRLERHVSAPSAQGRSPADLVLDYINAHCEEKLSGEQLSRVFSYHPNYINRLVTRATGSTLHRYILETKIRRACYLLSHTQQSVTDIAGRLGFYDSSHFTNVFVSICSITPSKYRENYK